MGWLRRWLTGRSDHVRTGTLGGNEYSALDDVIEDGPPLDFRRRGIWYARQREAVRGDMAVDLDDAFDDLEDAEQRRRDAFNDE